MFAVKHLESVIRNSYTHSLSAKSNKRDAYGILFYSPVRSNDLLMSRKRKIREKSSLGNKFQLPSRYSIGENVLMKLKAQVAKNKKIKVNLAQGYADFHPPKHIQEALAKVVKDNDLSSYQYARNFGVVELVQSLANIYSPLIGREINPMTEILIDPGAVASLYCAVLGHVDEGDEVIIIEPFSDCYDVMVRAAMGIPKYISLKPQKKGRNTANNWVLDKKELKSLFNQRTKMIILNNPNSPLGKVYNKTELYMIADLCKKYNVLCLCDEVYEFMPYKPDKHVRMASLGGMWERTVTVGSAGKMFSASGWKTGWAYGPANLMVNLQSVHNLVCANCVTVIQQTVAVALKQDLKRGLKSYLNTITYNLRPKREYMMEAIKKGGLDPVVPNAGFFMLADWSELESKIITSTDSKESKDYKFAKTLALESGVLVIPASVFYSAKHKRIGEDYIAFCFMKKDRSIKMAGELMEQWHKKKEDSIT